MNLFVPKTYKQRYCQYGCAKRSKTRPAQCSLCDGLRDHIRNGPIYCAKCRADRREKSHKRKRLVCGSCGAAAASGRGPALCAECRLLCMICGGQRELHFRLCRQCKPEYDRRERERNANAQRERNRRRSRCKNCRELGAFNGYCDKCRGLCKQCFERPMEQVSYCKPCKAEQTKLRYRVKNGIDSKAVGRSICLECHEPTKPAENHKSISVIIKFCSSTCRNRYKCRRRRAARIEAGHQDYSRIDILNRDGWTCGICNKRIDRRRKFPDPKSASIDHIVPLSVGGADVPANVQAAHWECNIAKGNRAVNDQLRLVG